MALSTVVLLAPALALPADAPEGCVPVARIVSIQGSVQIQRSGQPAWTVVRKLDTVVCQGDVVHAGPRSRAALLIDPETLVRLDQSSTLSIRQTPDETIVEFTKDPGLFQRVVTAPNPCGAGYFISRFPRKFRVLTPFVNASVEGTEFLVAMRCESALVAVFEGRVRAEEVLAASTFTLKEGESVEAGVGQPAAMKLVVKPVDAVQWALYYPPLTEAAGEAAADQKCDQADNAARSVCLVQRAEQRLRSGRVEEAEADVQTLLTLGLGDGDAYALLSILQVVKNDKTAALDLANRATQLSPNSPRAWIALSYANQAAFDLEKALAAANKAAELAPGSATVQARVAELLMSLGRVREAEKAAEGAVAANPNESRAHMVLGFVHLAQINTKAAREDFINAIERDSTEPLARLGLGLAIIRDGDLKAGREQIEIAVALDPTNSLLRSYAGKAYYEENTKERDQLAATQFGIARRLDPKDPTPWFYDAILKQTQNQSVAALEDLQQSIELNDNRAVYRSRLLLDEDRAAREASVSRIYRELGFARPAISEAATSLTANPQSYSAHRFLSDAYSEVERHEIARASELLQAQLLQPLNLNPLQPSASFTDLAPSIRQDPVEVSFNDYAHLFERRGLRFLLSGLVGNEDTYGSELVVSALTDRLSLSAGRFAYATDGFRPNNDFDYEVYNAFLQYLVSPDLSIQFEVRRREKEHGDIRLTFDPDFFAPEDRFSLDQDIARVGLSWAPTASTRLIASLIYTDRSEEQNAFPSGEPVITATGTVEGTVPEVQLQHLASRFNIVAGGSASQTNDDLKFVLDWTPIFGVPCPPPVFGVPCEIIADDKKKQRTAYLYANLRPFAGLLGTVGLAYDSYEQTDVSISEWNPKLGLIWSPNDQLRIRAAWFKGLKRSLIVNQTIEPTEIAGFNQLFDDFVGTKTETLAGGLDLRLGRSLRASFEARDRELSIESSLADSAVVPAQNQDEHNYFGILHWTFATETVAALSFEDDRFSWAATVPTDDPVDLRTRTTAVALRTALGVHWFGEATTRYVDQRVTRQAGSPAPAGKETFATTDIALGYRFPRRRGTMTLSVQNLFDQTFSYQDNNFRTNEAVWPLYTPARTIVYKVVLSF